MKNVWILMSSWVYGSVIQLTGVSPDVKIGSKPTVCNDAAITRSERLDLKIVM